MQKDNKFNDEIYKLIYDMINLFEEKQRAKCISERAQRGRISPAGNDFEDRFAKSLMTVLPTEYRILVDYPLTYRPENSGRAITVYPDIIVVHGDIIKCILELKIDLGYAKDKWLIEKQNKFNDFRKLEKVSYLLSNGNKRKQKQELKVTNNTEIAFVILSAENDHGKVAHISGDMNCFILLSNFHPNNPNLNCNKKITMIRGEDNSNQIGWGNLKKFLNRMLDVNL